MRALACLLLLFPAAVFAASERLVRDGVEYQVSVRTPEQTSAFYAARGFPATAVQAISRQCFVTVGIVNKRSDTLWLELPRWRFTAADGGEVARIPRADWEARWQALDMPLAARATFRWTQLPESRDLQPGEPVGGNVAVADPGGVFAVHASFRTGGGEEIHISVPGLVCPGRESSP